MYEILKSVQESIAKLEQGQTELKEIARKQRRDVAGILLLMKGAAGDFDERVGDLERRVKVPETQSQTG
jgi:hypothetical protein